MPSAADAVTAAKNGGAIGGGGGALNGGGSGNSLFQGFRRAQSLRFPRSSAAAAAGGGHCPSPSPSSGGGGGSANISRVGSRTYRSKSSKHRWGSMEAQSLLGRMSAGQRCVLVATWRQMRNQQGQLASMMRKILVELEQTEPTVKEIFYKASYVDCWEKASGGGAACPATFEEHIRLMTKFFDDLILSVEAAGPLGIEGGEEMSACIKLLGQQHAFLAHTSALPADVWDKLGEIAVDRVCQMECVQRTREAGRAWRTLIAFFTDKIRCGFEGEARAFSRRPSIEPQPISRSLADSMDDNRCEELGKRMQQMRSSTECGPAN